VKVSGGAGCGALFDSAPGLEGFTLQRSQPMWLASLFPGTDIPSHPVHFRAAACFVKPPQFLPLANNFYRGPYLPVYVSH
jgi:hypothetical protein